MFGLIAAVPTPIDNNGNPITELFLSHCSWVLRNGCDGINILGSTGEANSLNFDQRKLIMESASQTLNKNRLMVGTGTPSLSETKNLTEIADDLGYKVCLVLPPFYYKPLKNDGIYHWYKTLHEQLGKRKIKIYFYNFPQMTGINISVEVIEELHKDWPTRFTGIKDSSGDIEYCQNLSKNKNFKVFPSSEASIEHAQKSNFSGCISATANQTLFLSSLAWAKKNQNIKTLISNIKKNREEISKDCLIPSIKYLVSKRTNDNRWENLLPPFTPLTRVRKLELDKFYNNSLS